VAKPAVSGTNAIWYLGGFSDGGYSNTTTLSASTGGAPETPFWSVTANSTKISLSCTSCTFPLVTSQSPSANCAYDIIIQMSVGGLSADPFQFNVNEPWYLQSGGLSTTSDYGDGWLTLVPYINRDRCTYPVPSLSVNEHFGTFIRDNPAYSWNFPPATPPTGIRIRRIYLVRPDLHNGLHHVQSPESAGEPTRTGWRGPGAAVLIPGIYH
jgi:hypothetical protein